ncbi:TPA: type III secretion system needle filament subunit SctF, partial [Citrobacter werkmanii]
TILMNIANVSSQLLAKASSDWNNVQNILSASDLNNPLELLRVQQWLQEFSTEVELDSGMIKMVKDLLAGITSKI